MSEPEKRKVTCSVCKQAGHTKRTCAKKEPEPIYQEIKVEQVAESEPLYILLESGILGFTEYLPRVAEICSTPQDVVNAVNERIEEYMKRTMSGEDCDIPTVTLETIEERIQQKKIIVKIISLINAEHEGEDQHSMARYTLRLQVFTRPIRAHASAES